ncbi:hypothetical protein [Catenuloplanes atrovinosus]|uniref:Uncharacterized protein n=1 Tax=Catenuloplanes atrovinosus TaxID=137266 RepID=A0AAE4CB88_9ACTN|nr:hypothetical protein [Catenuloplanes atrovinosus]MDR7277843.1 hypothetical protein [Catenuloplanes atrovinosus]
MAVQPVQVEALFASHLQRSQRPTAELIRDAVRATVARHGENGVAALVAQEYGDHPETSAGRMRWAHAACALAYSTAA